MGLEAAEAETGASCEAVLMQRGLVRFGGKSGEEVEELVVPAEGPR